MSFPLQTRHIRLTPGLTRFQRAETAPAPADVSAIARRFSDSTLDVGRQRLRARRPRRNVIASGQVDSASGSPPWPRARRACRRSGRGTDRDAPDRAGGRAQRLRARRVGAAVRQLHRRRRTPSAARISVPTFPGSATLPERERHGALRSAPADPRAGRRATTRGGCAPRSTLGEQPRLDVLAGDAGGRPARPSRPRPRPRPRRRTGPACRASAARAASARASGRSLSFEAINGSTVIDRRMPI